MKRIRSTHSLKHTKSPCYKLFTFAWIGFALTSFLSCGNAGTTQNGGEATSSFYQPVASTGKAESAAKTTNSSTQKKSEKFDADVPLETPRLETKRKEQLIEHEGFRISYNANWCIPNWVAYELTKEETRGDVERTDYFDIDPTVSGRQARFSDYSHTGYDRGHMAPAGDMKWSKEAMDACFYLTNICPQNHNLNKGDWNDLEMKCRDWARRYGKVWIVTGPIVTSQEPKTIGSRHVVVPDAFYKVILAKKDGRYEGVGFVMNNADGNGDIMDDCHSIDEVENLTGIDFFYALPDEIEDKVEISFNPDVWR